MNVRPSDLKARPRRPPRPIPLKHTSAAIHELTITAGPPPSAFPHEDPDDLDFTIHATDNTYFHDILGDWSLDRYPVLDPNAPNRVIQPRRDHALIYLLPLDHTRHLYVYERHTKSLHAPFRIVHEVQTFRRLVCIEVDQTRRANQWNLLHADTFGPPSATVILKSLEPMKTLKPTIRFSSHPMRA